MTVPSDPIRLPRQRPLDPSVTSVTSVAVDKGDNEMIPDAVHRSPGVSLMAEANPLIHMLSGIIFNVFYPHVTEKRN